MLSKKHKAALPGKQKRYLLAMLNGLFDSSASSSRYTPLSGVVDSSVSTAYGMLSFFLCLWILLPHLGSTSPLSRHQQSRCPTIFAAFERVM